MSALSHADAIPFAENMVMQQIVAAAVELAQKKKSFLLLEKMVCGHTMIRRKSQERSGCFLNIAPKL